MTYILDFVTHIGNYAGVGMVMAVLGIALTVFAIIRLSGLRKKGREVARAEFNRQFVRDTGYSLSEAEEGAARKAAARGLGIGR